MTVSIWLLLSLSIVTALPASTIFSAIIFLVFGKCGATSHSLCDGSLTLSNRSTVENTLRVDTAGKILHY